MGHVDTTRLRWRDKGSDVTNVLRVSQEDHPAPNQHRVA